LGSREGSHFPYKSCRNLSKCWNDAPRGRGAGLGALGIDIGSAFVSAVLLDENGRILSDAYARHEGDIPGTLRGLLENIDLSQAKFAGCTGSGAEGILGLPRAFDPVVAIVDGSRLAAPQARNILYIGAGSYHLIRLSAKGEYQRHTSNSACASGTGAFLDQQAYRLNFRPEELSERAESCKSCPAVATRCSVFAKTDMIHLQQDGFPPEDIAAGLCRGLARSTVDALLQGQRIAGRTVAVGGVARNRSVVRGLNEQLGFIVLVPEHPELVAAAGAAVAAERAGVRMEIDLEKIAARAERAAEQALRPPLRLTLSDYPDFDPAVSYVDGNDTEVALIRNHAPGSEIRVVLGIDIGSTSTKCTLVDEERRMVALLYRNTAGDPIGATRHLFTAILSLAEKRGIHFEVLAAGTTGSGRKLIGRVLGAELERDEITAHAVAATFLDPGVNTILEIGGQDAKFTQLENGVVYNSVMNYVCAAGTGSFIEEQARKLGISISEYADFVTDVSAPITSDRCTVFMERDLDLLLSSGWSRREVAAAVLHSVRDNYLNKVVNGLRIGDRVYFQGATARNQALIAAFEQELGCPILVSPYCHVTGALGMSLLLLSEKIEERTFRGLSFAQARIDTETEKCTLCTNECTLTVIRTEDEVVAWGAKCGREYSELRRKVEKVPGVALVKARDRLLMSTGRKRTEDSPAPRARVGLPRALTTWSYLPFWRALIEGLDCELVLSAKSSKEIFEEGQKLVTAEFCAPIVMSHGHLADLVNRDVDVILVPQMIREKLPENVSDSHFCPYMQGLASVVKSLAGMGLDPERLSAPTIMLNRSEKWQSEALYEELGRKIGASRRQVRAAFKDALQADREFQLEIRRRGEAELRQIEQNHRLGVVLIGRPYNALDEGMNLDLPRKIAEKGLTVFPLDTLPVGAESLSEDWRNMYWTYGQRILAAAEYVASRDDLFAIFFTSFSCGPDSYLLSYVKEIMSRRSKPFLVLQLDGHGADAGYLTRVEAAIESFRAWSPRAAVIPIRKPEQTLTTDRKVFIPPMDPLGAVFLAASFRGFGYDAAVLEENQETLATGYKHTLGGECVPCPSTAGSLLCALDREGIPPSKAAFFMPTACGPCRFGQYATLDRLILEKRGQDEVLILSPSAVNAYQGLPDGLRKLIWDCILLADLVQKVTLATRPYESEPGATDRAQARAVAAICREFENGGQDLPSVLREALPKIHATGGSRRPRPQVGVVGEIYVRNDPFINRELIRTIEGLGGETHISSLAEWILYTDYLHRHGVGPRRRTIGERLTQPVREHFLSARERLYYDIARPWLGDRAEPELEEIIEAGKPFVPLEFQGEAILTIGRAILMVEQEGMDMVVNASPTFCMPGTISSAIFPNIEQKLGVPIVSIFYDGSGDPNRVLVPHLHYLVDRVSRGEERAMAEPGD
jgi:predicted CoA-substrate-specific enzyme activase